MKKTSWIFSDFLIGSVISLIIIGLFIGRIAFFESLEYKLYDLRAKFRKSQGPSDKITIVTIDDQSINNIGRWPWPRSIIAGLIDQISQFGPKVIGMNILFTDPDRNQGLEEISRLKTNFVNMMFQLQKKLKSKSDQELLMNFLQEMTDAEASLDNDAILSESISKAENIVLPMFFTLKSFFAGEQETKIPFLSSNTLTNIEEREKNFSVIEGFLPVVPLDLFANVSKGIGHSNLISDSDGVIRRECPVITYNGKYYPSFALQLVRVYLDLPLEKIKVVPGKELVLGKANIPLEKNTTMLIDFNGPAQTYPYYSVFDVITGKIPGTVFKDKIVIIGYMATGLTDLNVVPVGHNFPGTEIIANSIQNILEQRFIKRPPWAFKVELVTLLFCCLFITLILPRLKAKWGAIFSCVLLILIFASGFFLFINQGLWIKIFYSSFALVFGYTIITSKRFLLTEKRKELVEAESIETNKMLGLSFQGQGMLDLAFEKFRKCPIDDSVKDLLYNLGLDFERKRQFNKAVAVYEHIQTADPKYKDIQERIKMLKAAAEGVVFGTAPGVKKTAGETVILEGTAAQRPTLGRYEIIKELGRGAMGIVYLGRDPKINRTVAIKTLQFEEGLSDEEMKSLKSRFFREAESAGNLTHPNIIRIFDAGEDYDIAYIAMELLEGEDLKKYCSKDNLMPIKKVVDIMLKVTDALDYAHQQGVVHRDIKPANIMELKDGTIRITDFGIARIVSSSQTQTGTVLGTPSYMAPEQVAGKKVDGRADIFSLGVTFYELLTGEKPFKGESIATLIYQITNEKHPDPRKFRPEIPECIVKVIDKALKKNPDERYQRAKEMHDDLKKCLESIN